MSASHYLGEIKFKQEENNMKLSTVAWNVAFREKKSKKKFSIIKTGFLAWAADPFIYDYKNNTYLFAEYWEYKQNKGSIAVCNLNTLKKKWTVIIRESYHLSYPQIFSIDGNIYMCPEANESHSIYLYKAIAFPDQWEKQSPLMENIRAVDTTFFSYNQEIYCFTYDLDHNSLLLLKLDKKNMKLSLSPNNPISNNRSIARMAGNVLQRNQKYLRVSQDCSHIYGKALVFHQFQIHWPDYEEKLITKITSDKIPVNNKINYYGIHTYNESARYEVVDLKFNHFNLLELYYRIKRKILKLL